jgi:hypothetical protein
MTINRPRLLLAVCGVAGLVAFAPGGRRPPAESPPVAAVPEARLALAARPDAARDRVDDAAPAASAPPVPIHPPTPPETTLSDAAPPSPVGAEPAPVPAALPEAAASADV